MYALLPRGRLLSLRRNPSADTGPPHNQCDCTRSARPRYSDGFLERRTFANREFSQAPGGLPARDAGKENIVYYTSMSVIYSGRSALDWRSSFRNTSVPEHPIPEHVRRQPQCSRYVVREPANSPERFTLPDRKPTGANRSPLATSGVARSSRRVSRTSR